ncbi:MAG: hypothetical protein ABEJ31_00690 [Haloarculaceae archaeon]
MEIRVDVEEDLAAELAEEAALQGFDDRAAYLRWILAHRPMSDLAGTQAPAVASRVAELEERVKLLERQAGFDEPVDPDADLGDSTTPSTGSLGADGSEAGDDSGGSDGGASLDGGEPAADGFASKAADDEAEDAAEDDDIAEAIGDVSLDDE